LLREKIAMTGAAIEGPPFEISKYERGPGAIVILTNIASREKTISAIDVKAYAAVVLL
jgi:hypothetical protein